VSALRGVAGSRCVVVGGAGQVGSLLGGLLAERGAQVRVVDPAAAPGRPGDLAADVTDPSPALAAALAGADVVVLAVPEPVATAALGGVLAAMRPGALLVDTLSVKSRFVAALLGAGPRVEAVSLNPMFAPSLGASGRPVAVVVPRDGPRGRLLLAVLEDAGARLVVTTAERHDRLAAATQALTHAAVLAFGLALAELDADVDELSALAPPPHVTLLALLARVASGADETYWDVQAANPHAAPARAALDRGLHRLLDITGDDDPAAFGAALDDVRGFLGAARAPYRDLAVTGFTALHRAQHSPRLRSIDLREGLPT
jgi:4-amino-4-deoxyprephenate dehydrogenase